MPHFHDFPPDLDKEVLDAITEQVIEHCTQEHCTCDACIFYVDQLPIIIVTHGELMGASAIRIRHKETCYAMGRKN